MESFPLNKKCFEAYIIYKAQVSTEGKCAIYDWTADSGFKSRYDNYTMFFRLKSHMKDTELSKYFWHLHKENIRFDLIWSVTAHAPL